MWASAYFEREGNIAFLGFYWNKIPTGLKNKGLVREKDYFKIHSPSLPFTVRMASNRCQDSQALGWFLNQLIK